MTSGSNRFWMIVLFISIALLIGGVVAGDPGLIRLEGGTL
jgi:hypothetical protein